MYPLNLPGIDDRVSRYVVGILRPVWALGVRPRLLGRVLVCISILIEGLLGGLSLAADDPLGVIYVIWVGGFGFVLTRTIPRWDGFDAELTGGTLSLELLMALRRISVARTSLFFGLVSTGGATIIVLAFNPGWWASMLASSVALGFGLVALHVTTILGRPGRSIQRRAADRVKEMVASRPRLALNPQLG